MYVWCAILFCLGILAFLDTIFNMGDIFRTVNSILFMLISMGLLVRTTSKRKEHRYESLQARIHELERQIADLKATHKALSGY
ncbi:MAG: hypothetical protein HY851_10465 [candidate division Zixibacteria bacterium]|nr:hypothetical protein [candidate division Zixibacteria bacterium]